MSPALFAALMGLLDKAPEIYKKAVELWSKVRAGHAPTEAELLLLYSMRSTRGSYDEDINEAKREADALAISGGKK